MNPRKTGCSGWFFLAKDCHFWAENTWDFVSLLKTFLWKLRITHQSAKSSTWYIVCWEQQEKLEGQLPLQSFVLGTDRERYWGRDSWSKPRISQNPIHWRRFCVWSLDLGWDVLGQSSPFDPQVLGHIYLLVVCVRKLVHWWLSMVDRCEGISFFLLENISYVRIVCTHIYIHIICMYMYV